MTFSTKAICTVLFVALSPTFATAQTIGHTGPGSFPDHRVEAVSDCGAGYIQGLIGQNIQFMNFPDHVRLIGPDTIVTFDYRPDRLNVAYDGADLITRVYCG